MIDGVIITPLVTYPDDRGYFREIVRPKETALKQCAQVSATMSYPGVIKAFHYHNTQIDLWYCASGMIQAVLYDRREGSKTFGETQIVPMGDQNPLTLYIPNGVAHGYKVLGNTPALVVYLTDHIYDPNDELRIPFDDPTIGFDWTIKPR